MPLPTILKLKKVGMYGVLKPFRLLTATSLGLLKVLFMSNKHQPQMFCFHSDAGNGSTHSKQSTNQYTTLVAIYKMQVVNTR